MSPLIFKTTGEPSGRLAGKEAIGAYWKKGLSFLPDLHFEIEKVLLGVDSIVILYKGPVGIAAEAFFLAPTGEF